MIKEILHNRFAYYKNVTIGRLYIDDEMFCYTLEDTVRAQGIKVYKETAICQNRDVGYKVGIRRSPSFKREMVILYTDNNKRYLEYGGIKFEYIYAHGGNDEGDTLGCVLVAHNRDNDRIYGTAEKKLFMIVNNWLNEGHEIRWIITNMQQEK